jgi:D-arabinose 5-phosphate isomerase GutQ
MNGYITELQVTQDQWPAIVSQSIVQYGSDVQKAASSVIAIGSGCAIPVARFASLLAQDRYSCCAAAVTPYEVVHSSLVADLAFLFSAKGEHRHVVECYETLQSRGVPTVVITARLSSPLIELASGFLKTTTVVSTGRSVSQGGFIPVESTLVLASLIARTLGKLTQKSVSLFSEAAADHERFTKEHCLSAETDRYHVISSRWASPAGMDFETRMTEAGFSVSAVTDPWNFAHGRYMPLFQGGREAAIMMSVAKEQVELERIAGLCRNSFPCGLIVARESQWEGALYCIIRSMLLVGHICGLKGIDPSSPNIPRPGNMVYEGTDLA